MTKHENTCDECGLPISICNAKAMFELAVSRNGREAVIAAILDAKTEQTEQPTPEAVTRLTEAETPHDPRQPPHRKEAISFSAHEALMIRAALAMPSLDGDNKPTWADMLSMREWKAFVQKIEHIK